MTGAGATAAGEPSEAPFRPLFGSPAQAGCPAPLDEWVSAKPLPLTDFGECPPFPTDVLPAAVGDMVRAVAEATQTDEGMAGGCALTTLGACAGRRIEVHPRLVGWRSAGCTRCAWLRRVNASLRCRRR